MVRFFSTCSIAATLAVLASAAPSNSLSVKPFSFEEWARGLVENPGGDNLTPDEAVAAYNASMAVSRLENRGADPAVQCRTDRLCYVGVPLQYSLTYLHSLILWKNNQTGDAVKCINYLAGKGQTACRLGGGFSVFCTAANCGILGNGEQGAAAPWYACQTIFSVIDHIS